MRRITFGIVLGVAFLAASGTMLGAAQSAAPKFGNCKPTGKFGSIPLAKTVHADTWTDGFVALGPRTYRGNTPSKVNDGFNYCFVANMAWRAGLHKIKLVKVDFAQLVVGRLSGFDTAIDDIYIKPERAQHVDFSIPYGHSWSGILARTDSPATQANLKDLVFGVTLGSVQQKYLDEVLKPNKQYHTFDDPPTAFAALQAKQIDAVLLDIPVVLPAAAASNGAMQVYGVIKAGGTVGVVMQKPSPNRIAINKMIKQMQKDGTLKALEKKYYFATYGGIDPDTLPVWG